jgi:endonuclease YncB( thermonuclease family)
MSVFQSIQPHYTCRPICAIVLATLLFALNADAATLYGRVAHVVDGDTLDLIVHEKRIRVRILDIDAPEHAQPYGQRSRQSLIAICGGEQPQIDGSKHDRNGRLLAYIRCNGVDAGAEQVRQGMAWVFVRYAPADSPLYAIEAEAQAARRGLWATEQRVPPWEWRRH